MVDPRERDPRFPNRPQHEDFYLLSEVVQDIDNRAVTEVDPFEMIGIDENSITYLADERCAMAIEKMMREGGPGAPGNIAILLKMIYIDAFALGKLYTEKKQSREKD